MSTRYGTMRLPVRPRLNILISQQRKQICTLRIQTLGNKVTLIDVITCGCVGYACGPVILLHAQANTSSSPRGTAGLHLFTSLQIASTNGKLGRSSNVGSRCLIVTASISLWAIIWISGRSKAATKNGIKEDGVWKRSACISW